MKGIVLELAKDDGDWEINPEPKISKTEWQERYLDDCHSARQNNIVEKTEEILELGNYKRG